MAQSENDHGLHAVAITDRVEQLSRRLARTWAVVAVSVFVMLAVTVGFPHGPDLELWERQAQLLTLVILAIGTVVAWHWEGIGGGILVVAAASLGVFAALQHQPLLAFIPAAVFLVPAVAFLVAWHRTKSVASIVFLATVVIMVLFTGSVIAQSLYDHGYGPSHPESDRTALPDSPVTWLWTGGVTDTSATIVARVEDADTTTAVVTDDGGRSHSIDGVGTDGVWRFELSQLIPKTNYTYSFIVDDILRPERSGSFHTFSSQAASFTVAISSCARLGSNGAVYDTILQTQPDLFLVPGDFFYADYMETAAQFTESFDKTLTQPAQAALLASVPVAYVWDDHDYGGNDSDRTAPTRRLARDAYTSYVPHYALPDAESINQSFSIGRVQFILLDGRSMRDPNTVTDGRDKTMLGTTQFGWLQEQLLAAASTHSLTIVVSSVPWIAAAEPGADHWGGYTSERVRLANFIADHDINNILMVAGDAHMVAIDDGTNTDYSAAGNAAFPLLHAAALDRPGSAKGGPYSEGAFPGGGQFGLVEIVDTGGSEIEVRLAGLDWTGVTIVDYSFTVSAAAVAP